MSTLIKELILQFAHKKLAVAVMCFTIILLDGFNAAQFSNEVLTVATSGLVAFIGAQAAQDIVKTRNGG